MIHGDIFGAIALPWIRDVYVNCGGENIVS